MHVFVTGGTGTIGTAVVAELITAGHSVSALARSDRAAAALAAAGATPVPGAITDLDVLRAGARDADGVVSLAFSNDFSSPEALTRAIEEESAAMAALGGELVGTDRPFVVVSGTPWITGRRSVETDPLPLEGPVAGRARSVGAALALAARGVRTSAIRLPRTVHADGAGGFAGILTETARQSGVAGYPGDGEQRWPAVHARDAAVLFRLALEGAPAGTAWHAVADEGDRVRDIAAVIGRRLGLPVERVADETFGAFAPIFATDQPSSSEITRRTLGWEPVHPSLLADLEHVQP
ncbi:nucleoside-diphosphate-sugar epimerase [Curtobacterium sp. PhB130]|uniref:NAD-dependent epimerase/dehydratase family protein n=1 Tax=unclassified Curtobacterium TaxID=257496 RepID=UPI000F4C3536|nr:MULTISPECIES: NAD-dependent epimerase/dehydratase family protein [unclassified Curtobacterium]ROS76059.1 nucleoside-diphosphate-sugar epimerase [Curtobacterium sp. PhB130]TCK64245.1 nucleoside-diphosphate-sugar epimerase [Curtobacterium sp. PhB136]